MSELLNPTAILIVSVLLVFGLSMVLWAIALHWGLKWSGAMNPTWRRIAYATFFANFIAPLVTLYVFMFGIITNPLLAVGLYLILLLSLTLGSLMLLFRLSLGRSFKAWLPTLLTNVVLIGISPVYKAYVFEAFQAPTNSMAPSILGDHVTVKCPVCGKPAYGSIYPNTRMPIPHNIICEDFHISDEVDLLRTQPEAAAEIARAGLQERDHFVAAKFLQPRRWDLIIFRWPEDPEILYIKRLIGLPGEIIVIRDGSVWANGQKLEPPPELQGIKYYASEMYHGFGHPELHGSEARPANLGPGEYYVLGDFTAAAADSRYWQRGAPGHPPYAVPADYIQGVVTHRFWPLHRWHCFQEH